MTDDIVTRLRRFERSAVCVDAAAEIIRLRGLLDREAIETGMHWCANHGDRVDHRLSDDACTAVVDAPFNNYGPCRILPLVALGNRLDGGDHA